MATPEIGAIIIHGKKGFCGFLGGSYVSISVSVGPLALKKWALAYRAVIQYTEMARYQLQIAGTEGGG